MTHTRKRTLSAFMQISLDGYFYDSRGDMSFAHKPPDDREWNAFVADNAGKGGMLLLGRATYEMMAAWWPTPMAAQAMPEVATAMNARPKIVFSRTLRSAEWLNTSIVNDDAVSAVKRLLDEPGPDMAILGSGTLVTSLVDAGLIDTLQVVVCPVALGAGTSFLSGLATRADWLLERSRIFENGSVALWYAARRQNP